MKDVLSAMGYSPAYTTSSGEIWYLSPLRKNETKPSFKICPKGTLPGYVMDVWYDHGEGKGDQILGFIKKYFGITDDSAAIQKLSEVISNSNSGLTYEGFFDFLSYLFHNSLSKPPMPVIVMNSVAMGDKAIEAVRQMGAQTVHLYLDLDSKGREQAERFKRELQDVNVLDQSHIYTGYNDYSEFLEVNTQKAKSVSR